MEKKAYCCDYCRRDCEHTPDYVMPDFETQTEFAFRNGVKLAKFDRTRIVPKQVDICPSCQNKIARMANLLRYVMVDVDQMEMNIYETFMKATTKGIPEP